MFEKYSERARQAVFFARYEASQVGSPYIEPEHLLLGALRADKEMAIRLLGSFAKVEALREQIQKQFPAREKLSTSVDLPVSKAGKRVMKYASEESKRLAHDRIGPEHLLIGIAREENCFAAKALRERELTTARLREQAVRPPAPAAAPAAPVEELPAPTPAKNYRDLTAAAGKRELSPLIGRQYELERVLHILSRRSKNNPVLIGEPGVGKTAIVEGLAQRIVNGEVPSALAARRILAVDAAALVAPKRRFLSSGLEEILDETTSAVIFAIEGLFDLTAAGSVWAVLEASHVLEPHLARGAIQCIATGTPSGLRHTIERVGNLARHFEVVAVAPPTEAEAIPILRALQPQYESFHQVTFAEGAIEAAIYASSRFLMHRYLPDRAIDLLDEAGARARLRIEMESPEMIETRRRIRVLTREAEIAIANHEPDKARKLDEQERNERANLERLRDERKRNPPRNTVTADDIAEAVAERAGVPVSDVRSVLAQKGSRQIERIAQELAALIPPDANAWVPFLAAWLSRATPEQAEKLAAAIRAGRAILD